MKYINRTIEVKKENNEENGTKAHTTEALLQNIEGFLSLALLPEKHCQVQCFGIASEAHATLHEPRQCSLI